MRNVTRFTVLSTATLFGFAAANAETRIDFSNPAVAMSADAVIASGACIAKYAGILDDLSKSPAEIGQKIAQHCAKEISLSAGLSTWMVGRPEDYSKTLRYTSEELTTSTVVRARAAAAKTPI